MSTHFSTLWTDPATFILVRQFEFVLLTAILAFVVLLITQRRRNLFGLAAWSLFLAALWTPICVGLFAPLLYYPYSDTDVGGILAPLDTRSRDVGSVYFFTLHPGFLINVIVVTVRLIALKTFSYPDRIAASLVGAAYVINEIWMQALASD
ncbi:MAG: hypothetical protein AB7J28_06070 [Hyphomonadaceae bacterium]